MLNLYRRHHINPFVSNKPFFYPQKTSENLIVNLIGNEWVNAKATTRSVLQMQDHTTETSGLKWV